MLLDVPPIQGQHTGYFLKTLISPWHRICKITFAIQKTCTVNDEAQWKTYLKRQAKWHSLSRTTRLVKLKMSIHAHKIYVVSQDFCLLIPTNVRSVAWGNRLSSSSRERRPMGFWRNISRSGRLSSYSTAAASIPSLWYSIYKVTSTIFVLNK